VAGIGFWPALATNKAGTKPVGITLGVFDYEKPLLITRTIELNPM